MGVVMSSPLMHPRVKTTNKNKIWNINRGMRTLSSRNGVIQLPYFLLFTIPIVNSPRLTTP